MMGHKIRFYVEMWIIIPKLSLLPLLISSTESGFIVLYTDSLGGADAACSTAIRDSL